LAIWNGWRLWGAMVLSRTEPARDFQDSADVSFQQIVASVRRITKCIEADLFFRKIKEGN